MSNEQVKIVAPSDLEEGYEFVAELDGKNVSLYNIMISSSHNKPIPLSYVFSFLKC